MPAGAEFQVNTYTAGNQYIPRVAMDPAGDSVVTWASFGQDGSGYGVYAQRYNAAGTAEGSEFRVNTHTAANQTFPSVAMDAAGDFVIAWASYNQDGSGYGIYAQRYNAAGAAQGGEFHVSTTTAGDQSFPTVAMDAAGDFVVAWDSDQGGSTYGIYAQRYNAAGAAEGSQFQVNTYNAGNTTFPTIGMDAAGDFVIAWNADGEDGSGYGIYAQRYNAAGTAQGSEFRVNTYTKGDQIYPTVGMDSAGDFVVGWESGGQDGSGYGIYAQRYNAAGAAQGSEFQVNTYTAGDQQQPSLAIDAHGDFLIAWESPQDGSPGSVYAQQYSAAGAPVGGEFKVNTYAAGAQKQPTVALDANGDAVIAWESDGAQDGSGYGIYAQRYTSQPTAVPDTFVLSQSATSNGSGPTSVLANDVPINNQPLTATLVTGTAHGQFTLNSDGSFSYTPNSTFQGSDSFAYQVSEGTRVGNKVADTLLSYNASLVDKLYHQVLHRSAEDAGLTYWTSLLNAGDSLDVVAEGIFNSPERLDPLITQYYEQYLLRGPDPGGLSFWVADWQATGDPANVQVGILDSQEFFNDAGDTNDGFVTLLYQRVLGRAPDAAGLGYWTGLLDSGMLTRSQVAAGFESSAEQHALVVDFLFGEYFLDVTPPDPTPYIDELNAGVTQTQVELNIINSPAYANNPPEPAAGTVGLALYEHVNY
ncbi:MAG TPA: DUF4214 domain-containing protein [Pirellulales bacterium]|nr:DUF4214 domain-containing protein [Pirellulales bacterium]